ncbi:MAG: 50S ribosomal protein L19 [Spirochaetia bacterium]|nr:50S ribosomal protein L19 [Spirochaetia bacterium]
MKNILDAVKTAYTKKGSDIGKLAVGSVLKVNAKIKEGGKERIQAFEGILISKRGTGLGASITVRKIGAGGIGVERIFPINSPMIDSVVVVKQGDSSKAKLYHLRDAFGAKAKKEAKKFGTENMTADSLAVNQEAAALEAERQKSKEDRKAEHSREKAAAAKGGKKK